MPHDMNGTKLEVGDLVLVPCVVTAITASETAPEEWCNVILQTSRPMFPSEHPTGISLNASQVRRSPWVRDGVMDAILGKV